MLRLVTTTLLLAFSILASVTSVAREYIIFPQWQSIETDFRQAIVTDDDCLTDSYCRMGGDTVHIIDTQASGQYALNIQLDITNIHAKAFTTYPQYYYNEKGIKCKGKPVERPIYGWVLGMKDMQHYNAIWMRTTIEEDVLYDNDAVEFRVVTINGNDTTYHTDWKRCSYKNEVSKTSCYSMWIQYNNNTIWFGGGWNNDLPWDIVHNIPSFGQYTGLYLSAGAKVSIDNAWIIVNDKETQPHTGLTAEIIDNHFQSHSCHPIEGFWKVTLDDRPINRIKMGGDYSLAIVANDSVFNAIYLDGAQKYPNKWREGDVKAVFTPTIQGHYEVGWYDAEGEKMENVLAFLYDDYMNINFIDEKTTLTLTRDKLHFTPDSNRTTGGSGTGFAITADGLIATNHHVIADAKKLFVRVLNDSTIHNYNAVVVASDPGSDLAIIRIDDQEFHGFDPLPYSISNRIARRGEKIFYMGYPQPSLLNNELKTWTGEINATNSLDDKQYMVSLGIDHGSSGSPVFDNDGYVIGVVTSLYNPQLINLEGGLATKSTYLLPLAEKALGGKLHENNNQIKELSHLDRIDAIAPYIFIIYVIY